MSARLIVALATLVIVLAIVAAFGVHDAKRDRPLSIGAVTQPPILADAKRSQSAHYLIYSTATAEQTESVSAAVEQLHTAYSAIFPVKPQQPKLTLVLYRDRHEFKRNNRSSPWAEAYYLRPRSHAYFDGDSPNPYHWMLHEATHQLSREASGFKINRWMDEGLATYFSTSLITQSGLQLGTTDGDTYPIWWLNRYAISGDKARDTAAGQFIPLLPLLTGMGGPDVNTHFNNYYICAWSLTHFLLHFDNGKHAGSYRQLIARGASPASFKALIGPLDRIEDEWYVYLVGQVRLARGR